MRTGRPTRPIEDRFWDLVEVLDINSCWEWKGYTGNRKYGTFQIKNKNSMAHRISWMIHNGEIPNGLLVCHKCDNPSCVNPNHLFLGTPKDNMDDMNQKGRARHDNNPRGNLRRQIKIRDEQVLDIRHRYLNGESCNSLSKEYGVGRAHIERIVSGKRREHVK